LYQWREEFVSELATFLRGGVQRSASAISPVAAPRTVPDKTLHDAMVSVLKSHGDPMPARQVSNEIARLGLYSRQDGKRADYQQILARAKKYPELFVVTRSGIGLR
jgi:hypothetical protein